MFGELTQQQYFDTAMHVAIDAQDGIAEAIRSVIEDHNQTPDDMPATVVGYFDKDTKLRVVEAPAPHWSTAEEKAEWVEDIKYGCKELNALYCIVITGAWVAKGEGADIVMKSEGRMRVSELPPHLREDVILLHMSCARGDRLVMFEATKDSEVHDTGVCDEANQLDGDMIGFIERAPRNTTVTDA